VILADTSVWVDHLRHVNDGLVRSLESGQVLAHPFVIGEIALGHLRRRDTVLDHLLQLPRAVMATDDEVLRFIGQHALFGRGIGYIDAHLLAAVRLTEDARLWTADRRLRDMAETLGLAGHAERLAARTQRER
jgi:predicted nucleic acid-binding protein